MFLGGEDDGLDLDRCDAEVVGNVFTGFHSNADNHWANAISLADGSRVTVKNNICADNDHGIAAYHGAVLTAVRNTLYGNRVAAVNLEEDDLPGGATLDLCILWNNGASFRGRERATKLTVTRCVLPEAADWPDAGNLAQDPRFRDAKNGNFLPAKDSPAAGRGADLSRPPTSLFK